MCLDSPNYNVSGVLLCAQIDSIPALNDAFGVDLDGLILRAGLAVGTRLQLDIDLPVDGAVSDGASSAANVLASLKLKRNLAF